MSKPIFVIILTVLAFSLGVIADETLKSDGWSWQKIPNVRQLGFLEGFAEGTDNEETILTFGSLCDKEHGRDSVLTSICILSRLHGDTYLPINASKTMETMNRLYTSPQNLPIHWGHALIISQAMVSGVPVSEKDLEVIRQCDAMPPKPISEKEMRDILSNTPKKQ